MATINDAGPTVYLNIDQIEQLGVENFQFKTPTEQKYFTELVDYMKGMRDHFGLTPTLPFPEPSNAADLNLLTQKLDDSGKSFGFSMSAIMQLMHEVNEEMRLAGKEIRGAMREVEQNKLQAAADQIRKAAAFALAAGIVSGVMQIASGAMSGVAAAKAGYTSLGKLGPTTTPTPGSGQMQGQAPGQQPGQITIGTRTSQLQSQAPNQAPGQGPGQPPGQNAQSQASFKSQMQAKMTAVKDKMLGSDTANKAHELQFTNKDLMTQKMNNEPHQYPDYHKPGLDPKIKDQMIKDNVQQHNMSVLHSRSTIGGIQQQSWQAVGMMFTGVGTTISTALSFQKDMEEAEKAEIEAEARKAGYQVQDWDDFVKNMSSDMSEIRNMIRDVEGAQTQTEKAIWQKA